MSSSIFKSTLAALLLAFFACLHAHAETPVLIRTQFRTNNLLEPGFSFFEYNSSGKLQITTGFNVSEEQTLKPGNTLCDNVLQNLSHYALKKMYDHGYMDLAEYSYYRRTQDKLDATQVTFLNMAVSEPPPVRELRTISVNPHDQFGWESTESKTLMNDFTVAGSATLTDLEFVSKAMNKLMARTSLRIIRNQKQVGNTYVKANMAWENEGLFSFVDDTELTNGMSFELGKAATDNSDYFTAIFKIAVQNAMSDVLALGKNIYTSQIYADSLTPAHTAKYILKGFEVVETLPSGESLMRAKVLKLFTALNPIADFYETIPYLEISKGDAVAAIKLRNKARDAYTQLIESADGTSNFPLVITFHKDWYAFLGEELETWNEEQRSTFIMNSSSTPDLIPQQKIPEYFLQSQTAGNHIFGFDEETMKKDSYYLIKQVAGVYHYYFDEMEKTAYSVHYGHKLIFESPMVLYFKEEDVALKKAAEQIGAKIRPVEYQKRILTKEFQAKTNAIKGYEAILPIKNVQAIAKMLGEKNIPKLVKGRFQAEVNRLNGL